MLVVQWVVFDDFYLVVVFDGFGQVFVDIVVVGDDDLFVVVVEFVYFVYYCVDMGFGGDEEDFVVGFDYCVVLGNDWLVVVVDCGDVGIYVWYVFVQLVQFLFYQRVVVVGFDFD